MKRRSPSLSNLMNPTSSKKDQVSRRKKEEKDFNFDHCSFEYSFFLLLLLPPFLDNSFVSSIYSASLWNILLFIHLSVYVIRLLLLYQIFPGPVMTYMHCTVLDAEQCALWRWRFIKSLALQWSWYLYRYRCSYSRSSTHLAAQTSCSADTRCVEWQWICVHKGKCPPLPRILMFPQVQVQIPLTSTQVPSLSTPLTSTSMKVAHIDTLLCDNSSFCESTVIILTRFAHWSRSLFVERELSYCQETDSSAHLHKWSKQHYVSSNSRFDPLYRCFRKQHGHVLCSHFVHCLRRRVCTRALIA